MNDIICLSSALAEVRTRLEQPGVLLGRQRSPDFKSRVVKVAATILRFHLKAVRVLARLGEAHRFPFARRAVERLCGIDASAIYRAILILERIGFLASRSALARWYEGNTRSQTPGAQPCWFKPTQFQLGDEFAAIIVDGAAVAVSPPDSLLQSEPEETPYLQRKNLDSGEHQPSKEFEDSRFQALRLGSTTSMTDDVEIGADDDVDNGVEAALERFRRTAVPEAMPDDRRAPQPSPDDKMANLEARRGTIAQGCKLSASAWTSILRRR